MCSSFTTIRKLPHSTRVKAATVLAAVLVAGSIAMTPVAAASKITVAADRAKVLSIAGTPSAVIVGNPTYADVTIRNGQIVIHGRHYGSTNILVLDTDGNELANMDVSVTRDTEGKLNIYKAGLRHTFNCAPSCEAMLEVGDSPTFFNEQVSAQITGKTGVAQAAANLSD
jgi:Flp pilus assembly secretin CpaC